MVHISTAVTLLAHVAHSEPHHQEEKMAMLQLREKKVVVAEDKGATSHRNKQLAFVENLAATVLRTNMSIDAVAKAALETIDTTLDDSLLLINNSHAVNQGQIDDQLQVAQTCVSNFTAALADNAVTKSDADGKGTQHANCRSTLGTVIDDKNTKCANLQTHLDNLVPPSCVVPVNAGKDGLSSFWTQNKAFYESGEPVWENLQELCDNATALGVSTEVTCDSKQTAFENALCTLERDVLSTCHTYETCEEVATADYTSLSATSSTQADARKVEYTGAVMIKCFIQVLLSEEGVTMDQINACKDSTPDVTHLNLTVPPLPVKQECDKSSIEVVPCDAAFTAQYESMYGVDECVPCPALPGYLGGGSSGGDFVNFEDWEFENAGVVYSRKVHVRNFKKVAGATASQDWDWQNTGSPYFLYTKTHPTLPNDDSYTFYDMGLPLKVLGPGRLAQQYYEWDSSYYNCDEAHAVGEYGCYATQRVMGTDKLTMRSKYGSAPHWQAGSVAIDNTWFSKEDAVKGFSVTQVDCSARIAISSHPGCAAKGWPLDDVLNKTNGFHTIGGCRNSLEEKGPGGNNCIRHGYKYDQNCNPTAMHRPGFKYSDFDGSDFFIRADYNLMDIYERTNQYRSQQHIARITGEDQGYGYGVPFVGYVGDYSKGNENKQTGFYPPYEYRGPIHWTVKINEDDKVEFYMNGTLKGTSQGTVHYPWHFMYGADCKHNQNNNKNLWPEESIAAGQREVMSDFQYITADFVPELVQ